MKDKFFFPAPLAPRRHSCPQEGSFTVYLAADGFLDDLLTELGPAVLEVRERLVLASGAPQKAAWAQNIWKNPRFLPIASIGEAARALSSIQRNWHLHSIDWHRRAALIQQKLPHVSARPITFGDAAPSAPLGSWTLWDQNLLLASPDCTSPFPDGMVAFHENRTDPPSRAYLKLWETFTLIGKHPVPGELCLDLGSAPGGWTWVAASLGAHVFSIDKAPLAPNVEAMPNVSHCIGSGFALDPRHVGQVDWFLSDMICYPDRLHEAVTRWIELGNCKNFVCTIKLQAETDHEAVARFAAIPGSRVVHLSCNKHELTWIRLAEDV